MPKDWKEIDIDEMLNFEGAHTGQMERYERIMRQKEIEAMKNVYSGLFDLQRSIHLSTEKIEARLKTFEKLLDKFSKTQGWLQRITVALTIAIALSTAFYTWITWQAVQAQREANLIQEKLIEKSKTQDSNRPPNSALKPKL